MKSNDIVSEGGGGVSNRKTTLCFEYNGQKHDVIKEGVKSIHLWQAVKKGGRGNPIFTNEVIYASRSIKLKCSKMTDLKFIKP